jgi:hypothetical protein
MIILRAHYFRSDLLTLQINENSREDPCYEVDGRIIGSGKAGPITTHLLQEFRSIVEVDGVKGIRIKATRTPVN